ncbi:hypothetical protein [Desulfosporosinus sp. OT]|nr:hypothetical protein [Desulfosporosinus sp. OT]EGW36837.1 hypothetical protein DOT_5302 [Desulfosporosinus sp. OT]
MTAKATATRVKGTKKKITMDGDFPEVKPIESNEKEVGNDSQNNSEIN